MCSIIMDGKVGKQSKWCRLSIKFVTTNWHEAEASKLPVLTEVIVTQYTSSLTIPCHDVSSGTVVLTLYQKLTNFCGVVLDELLKGIMRLLLRCQSYETCRTWRQNVSPAYSLVAVCLVLMAWLLEHVQGAAQRAGRAWCRLARLAGPWGGADQRSAPRAPGQNQRPAPRPPGRPWPLGRPGHHDPRFTTPDPGHPPDLFCPGPARGLG